MIYHIHSVYIYMQTDHICIYHTHVYMVVLIYAYNYGINYPGLRWSLVFLVPRLQVLLDETFKTRSTRDRQGKMPKRLRLVKCHRLEDSSMWSWYLSRCLVQIEPTLKCPEKNTGKWLMISTGVFLVSFWWWYHLVVKKTQLHGTPRSFPAFRWRSEHGQQIWGLEKLKTKWPKCTPISDHYTAVQDRSEIKSNFELYSCYIVGALVISVHTGIYMIYTQFLFVMIRYSSEVSASTFRHVFWCRIHQKLK